MRRQLLTAGLALWAGLTLTSFGLAQDSGSHKADKHKGHHHHSFSDTEKYIKRFEDPTRDEWQKPDIVVKMLGLKPGMNAADIGAATGYFTRRMGKEVMPGGYALAVDLEDGFFPYLLRRAYEEDVYNVFPVKATPDDPRLPLDSLNVILIVNTLHHIEAREAYYQKLKASLRGDGRIVVVDFKKDEEIPFGPKPPMRLRATDVKKELETAGFSVEIDSATLPYQYVLTATIGDK